MSVKNIETKNCYGVSLKSNYQHNIIMKQQSVSPFLLRATEVLLRNSEIDNCDTDKKY